MDELPSSITDAFFTIVCTEGRRNAVQEAIEHQGSE
jgi:hypothetical protein